IIACHRDGHQFPVECDIFSDKTATGDLRICAFIRDIAELKKLREQERLVQEHTVKLIESNNELKQFAKIASHDLQEPLKTVQGFVHLLKQSDIRRLDSESADFIECIYEATERMQHLIQSVLRHSQVAESTDLCP